MSSVIQSGAEEGPVCFPEGVDRAGACPGCDRTILPGAFFCDHCGLLVAPIRTATEESDTNELAWQTLLLMARIERYELEWPVDCSGE